MSLGLALNVVGGAAAGGLFSYSQDKSAKSVREGVIAGIAFGALAFLVGQGAIIGAAVGVTVTLLLRNCVINKQNVFEGALIGSLTAAALALLR